MTGEFGIQEYRSFFVFDLTGVSNPFTNASFVFDTANTTGNATETLSLFDFGGSISALTGGTAGAAGFTDLGSGTSYGSLAITIASPGVYTIALNASGLAALNAALGGQFAIGGALTSIVGTGDQFIGGFSLGGQFITEIQGNTAAAVPEPASLVLLGSGLIGAAIRRRQRRKTA